MGAFFGHLVYHGQHLRAKMSENNPLCTKLLPVFADIWVIHMKADRLFVEIALTNE